MTALKWKRPEPGVYTCAQTYKGKPSHWVIRGERTDWKLYRLVDGEEVEIVKRHQKGLCQNYAQENPDAGLPKPKPKPVERGPAPTNSLDSILEGLRLELSQLNHMLAILTAKIDKLGH